MIPERLMPNTSEWDMYIAEHRQRYEFAAEYCVNAHVLDAACGVGYGSDLLHRKGAFNVLGVDLSSEAIQYAQENYWSKEVQFLQCAVEDLPFPDGNFDAVVSFETLEHLASPSTFLAEASRVLAPGGTIVCSTPNKDFEPRWGRKPNNPYHLSEMSFDEFCQLFSAFFEVESVFCQSHTEHYLRHMELVREMNQALLPLRFSLFLRVECTLRRLTGKHVWNASSTIISRAVRALPDDFQISRVESPTTDHLTFILVGRNAE